MKHKTVPLCLTILPLLAACAGAPASKSTPDIAAPAAWRNAAAQAGDTPHAATQTDWWRAFGSRELDELLARALQGNHDLAAAAARVDQAYAALRMADANRLPSLNAQAGAGGDGRLGARRTSSASGASYTAALRASYEIDLRGRNRALSDSAAAQLQASRYEREASRLSVTGAVVNAWLQRGALAERLAIADANIASAERMLALVAARVRAGAAHPLELAQQRGLLAAQQRQRAELRQQHEDSHLALALLLGQPAADVHLGVRPQSDTGSAVPLQRLILPAAEAGLPSALLARRPDIAGAEAQLAAAEADVAAARAALFPSLTLDGALASSAKGFSGLFDNPIYSLAAAIGAPLFDGGRLAAGRDLAGARRQELLAAYRRTVMTAFADVERALNAIGSLAIQRSAQDEELREAGRALALAEARYRAGAENALTLLDAQRTLYAAQDASLQLQLARLQAAVALHQALGGGWQQGS
ncbi:efflux transporter outer membrane subunit [Pseudoduganella violacea]|uniref:NodT family efflux transporter outer membrane factor (OMF) lipoprotein n=1 Tax=Pseudoduganella violacea TaxID=1715466 RepID=A0A7W5B6E3_9BURK|nr:efflux transporter outer membrane subunit [Pseudoduganella violacea]MBB3117281.1 NodT family efflux transporter outer membrane factor (OMF) lipoprotein [Pseudoduganella violacea]